MKVLYEHNWQVREKWYQWCEDVPYEELIRPRIGGVGGILQTLFHVADVEWSWIRALQGKSDFQESFESYNTLEKVRQLDRQLRPEVVDFVVAWDDPLERKPFYNELANGEAEIFAWGEVMRHVFAHQVHHFGQLSVWAREMGKTPVSANLIRNRLIEPII
ncbi:DinB family protein [Cohnella suwonensis]|uniref:DinB family protein n=1 Tax=Cohnella suwonensis TaxID=696072 RepID=A0ABW0LSF0_9BACL